MKISIEWISQYVDIKDIKPEEIANRLTMSTAEVEGIEYVQRAINGVVVGQIVEVQPIAGEKQLTVVVVDCGDQKFKTVCGAPNVKVGLKSAFAPPGVTIADGVQIEKSTIAGLPSAGILCSAKELGFSDFHEIILEIPAAIRTGTPLTDIMPESDAIIEIDNKSLTHRPDLWGHYGFAREIAAIFQRELKPLSLADLQVYNQLPPYSLEIADAEGCPCYCCLEIDLQVAPSPLSIQWRLHALGQRTFNLLIDLTNYIMLELGQPMHAFDGNKLSAVKVAPFGKQGPFKTLDGQERTMQPNDLMIWNEREPIAIAGVMGGLNTEVSETTTRLLLESANFKGSRIRRTSMRLGLRTDASQRFEKDQPPVNAKIAVGRFVHLVKEAQVDFDVLSAFTIAGNPKEDFRYIDVSINFLNRRIGMEIPTVRMQEILESIGFTTVQDADRLTVGIPPFRSEKDISIPEDILEEICRIYGFDNIQHQMPTRAVQPVHIDQQLRNEHKTRRLLGMAHEFIEVHSYSWFDDNWLQVLQFNPGETLVLKNPSAGNLSRLRTSLLPNLLYLVKQNHLHRETFRLFELGRIYVPQGKDKCHEITNLCGVSYIQTRSYDLEQHFREIIGVLEDLAIATNRGKLVFQPVSGHNDTVRLSGSSASVLLDNQKIGDIGIPDARILKQLAPNAQVIWFELEFDKFHGPIYPSIQYKAASEYPGSWLDFSIVWDTAAGFARLEEKVLKFTHPLIVKSEFYSLFKGKQLPPGKASYTFRYWIGLKDRTITGPEIESFRNEFLEFLKKENLELR